MSAPVFGRTERQIRQHERQLAASTPTDEFTRVRLDMADGTQKQLVCCPSCNRIGAAPYGLVGCDDCAILRGQLVRAKHEAELAAAQNAHDEFPLAMWLEWCAENVDPEAPTRAERRAQLLEDQRDAREWNETIMEYRSCSNPGGLYGDGVEV